MVVGVISPTELLMLWRTSTLGQSSQSRLTFFDHRKHGIPLRWPEGSEGSSKLEVIGHRMDPISAYGKELLNRASLEPRSCCMNTVLCPWHYGKLACRALADGLTSSAGPRPENLTKRSSIASEDWRRAATWYPGSERGLPVQRVEVASRQVAIRRDATIPCLGPFWNKRKMSSTAIKNRE